MKEGEVFPQKNYISNSVEETVRTVLPKYLGYSVEDIFKWVNLQMYESGIIDSSFGGGLDCADGCAMLLCSGDSEEPERVREAVLSRAEALLREGIGADYFLRMKRSALGRRIKGLDSFDGTCFRLCAYHCAGFDYFRFPAIYQDITPEEVLAFLARVVKPDRCALSVIDSVAEPAI